MKKFEYTILIVNPKNISKDYDPLKDLNDLGLKGWEAFSFTIDLNGSGIYTLKRELK